ncbi:MAG: metallophosphoesterase family protein [Acidobacteriota bacterium]
MTVVAEQHIDPRAREIYVDAMTRLMEAGVDFLVVGAYAHAPIQATPTGEPLEIMPFLGSSRPEEPIIRYRASVVFHGHAHHGSLEGRTKSDVPVFNVCYPLLKRSFPEELPFRFYDVPSGSEAADAAQPEASAFTT